MFLFSSKNAKYQPNFQFERKLECGAPAPKIIVSNVLTSASGSFIITIFYIL